MFFILMLRCLCLPTHLRIRRHLKEMAGLQELFYCSAMEKLTYIVKGKPERFLKIWNPFIGFLKELHPKSIFSM